VKSPRVFCFVINIYGFGVKQLMQFLAAPLFFSPQFGHTHDVVAVFEFTADFVTVALLTFELTAPVGLGLLHFTQIFAA
jgi:hypothetical protein